MAIFPLVAVALVALMSVMAVLGGMRYVAKARRTSIDLTAYQWVTEAAVDMMANLITSGAYLDARTKAPLADISTLSLKTQFTDDCNLVRLVLDLPEINDPRWGLRKRMEITNLKDYSMMSGLESQTQKCGSDTPVIDNKGLVITLLKKKSTNESPFHFLMENVRDSAFGGIEFQITRVQNDNGPQVPTVRIRAYAFPDGAAKLMSRRNNVYTEITYAIVQNTVATNALVVPGRLRLDQSVGASTLGSALTAQSRENNDSNLYRGDAVIPYVTAAESNTYRGIRFMSPVTSGFGMVMPNGIGVDPTTGDIAKVFFNAPLRFTNGLIMKKQEGVLKPYDPARTGLTLASSMIDLGRHVSLLERIVDYRREDLSLSKLFGIRANGVINQFSDICRKDQQWIDANTSRNSALVFKYDPQRAISSTSAANRDGRVFHDQAQDGPLSFFMSWTGFNRFTKQNGGDLDTSIVLKEAASPQNAFLTYPRKDNRPDDQTANQKDSPWITRGDAQNPIVRVSFALQKSGSTITSTNDANHDWILADMGVGDVIRVEMRGTPCKDIDAQVVAKQNEVTNLKTKKDANSGGGNLDDNWKAAKGFAKDYLKEVGDNQYQGDGKKGILDLKAWVAKYDPMSALPSGRDNLMGFVRDVFNIDFTFTTTDQYMNAEMKLPSYGCDPGGGTGAGNCGKFKFAVDSILANVFTLAIADKLAEEQLNLDNLKQKKIFADHPTRLELALRPHMAAGEKEPKAQPNTVKLEARWFNIDSLTECEPGGTKPVFFVKAGERGSDGRFGKSEGRNSNRCGSGENEDCSVASDTGQFVWNPADLDGDPVRHPRRFDLQNFPADYQTMSAAAVVGAIPDLSRDYRTELDQCFSNAAPPEVSKTDFSDYAKDAWNFSQIDTASVASDDGVIANNNRELIYKGQTAANFVGNPQNFTFPVNARVHRVIIKPDTTFVAGFFITDELVIEGGRSEELVLIASVVAGSLNIDKQALQKGIQWYSYLDPAAVPLMQKVGVLGRGLNCMKLRRKEELYASPAWQGKLRIFGSKLGGNDLDGFPLTNPNEISKEMVQNCAGSFLAPHFKQALSSTSLLPVGIPGLAETQFDVTNVHRGWPATAVPISASTNVTMGN